MTTQRERTTVTLLYPGSFLSEEGPAVEVHVPPIEYAKRTLKLNPSAFGAEIRRLHETRWTDGESGVMWVRTPGREDNVLHVFVGDEYTAEQVEAMEGGHSIMLANMRGNRWATVVRTRLGNWQPVEATAFVVGEDEL